MTVVRLEVLKQEDAELLIQLAKRLRVEKIEVSDDLADLTLAAEVAQMTAEELEMHLETAATTPRISFEVFKKEMSEWK